MANFDLTRAIEKMKEIRKNRELRYGNGIFDKDLSYFIFMLQEKINRLANNLGQSTTNYETQLDVLIDIMTYSAIAYESQLDKASFETTTKINKVVFQPNSDGSFSVFLDARFVGKVNPNDVIGFP
jgi:hypothetical protein